MTTKKLKGYSASKLEKELLGGPLTFGLAVESLRARDGISQVQLAKTIGISKQYLCDVEKGRRLVSPGQAARFAKAFGHPPELLVKLCLEDSLREDGLKMKLSIDVA